MGQVSLHSNFLVILITTYNRLKLLEKVIKSVASGTSCPHDIVVIDGGSSDGTVEFLHSQSGITPIFQEQLVGQARACNQVWRQIDCKFTCWLSDDTEIVKGSLDMAVAILENSPRIGMVGLKMKDIGNPKPYMGSLSEYGIFTCNHGVLPMALLRSVGFFNEDYHSYGIDPDLTASVLCVGKQVVMTKQISVLHHRIISNPKARKEALAKSHQIYREKFAFLGSTSVRLSLRTSIRRFLLKGLFIGVADKSNRWGLNRRDREILRKGSFFSYWDPFHFLYREYHLVQQIPNQLLQSVRNPYRHLLE